MELNNISESGSLVEKKDHQLLSPRFFFKKKFKKKEPYQQAHVYQPLH